MTSARTDHEKEMLKKALQPPVCPNGLDRMVQRRLAVHDLYRRRFIHRLLGSAAALVLLLTTGWFLTHSSTPTLPAAPEPFLLESVHLYRQQAVVYEFSSSDAGEVQYFWIETENGDPDSGASS